MATIQHICMIRKAYHTLSHQPAMLQSNFLTSLDMTKYVALSTPSWLKPNNLSTDTILRYLSYLILPPTFVLSAIIGLSGVILSLKDKIVNKRGVIILFIYLGVLAVIEVLVLVIRYFRGSKPVADEENQLGRSSTNDSVDGGSVSGSLQSVDAQGARRVIVRDPAGCPRV